MKGTVKEIIRQKSGLTIRPVYDDDGEVKDLEALLVTPLSANIDVEYDVDVYKINKKRIKKIKNCLFWLIQQNWIKFEDDLIIRNYKTNNGADATLESLNRPGWLYDFGDWAFLAPEGWD